MPKTQILGDPLTASGLLNLHMSHKPFANAWAYTQNLLDFIP